MTHLDDTVFLACLTAGVVLLVLPALAGFVWGLIRGRR